MERKTKKLYGAIEITPYEQLRKDLSEREHQLIAPHLEGLGDQELEDVCLAIVAWLRFGMRREFWDPRLQEAFEKILDLIIIERGLSIFYKHNNSNLQ